MPKCVSLRCCRRRCYPHAQCKNKQRGCQTDHDCKPGLECILTSPNPYCLDYDECTDPRYSEAALAYCRANTVCRNTIGSYLCVCIPGYEDFNPAHGCVDIDECNDLAHNKNVTEFCGPNTVCHNTEGWSEMPFSYNCSCNQGYELFMEFRGEIQTSSCPNTNTD